MTLSLLLFLSDRRIVGRTTDAETSMAPNLVTVLLGRHGSKADAKSSKRRASFQISHNYGGSNGGAA